MNKNIWLIIKNFFIKIWEWFKSLIEDTDKEIVIGISMARDLANRVIQAINQLVFSLQNTKGELPVLKNTIKEYIDVALNGKRGSVKLLKREIIVIAERIYDRNFPHGINHNTFRFGLLILWVLIALVLGFIIGFGLNFLFGGYEQPCRYNRYYEKQRRFK